RKARDYVPSYASSVSNYAYVLYDNVAYVPHDPLVTELNIYKAQVAIYEQRGVSNATKARRSQPKCNITHDRTLPANSVPKKNVEDHHRKNKSKLSKKNRVDLSTSIRRTIFNTNSNLLCKTPEHPPSPDYVPGPEHPPLSVEIPYVPEPKYPEYLVPSDAEAPLEDQPQPANASPTAASLGYVADSDPDEDPEEDLKDDHVDYPADRGDVNDEPNDDDDDTDNEDDEPFEDEEEEHLAPTDLFVVPIVDPVPPAGITEAFETEKARKTVRLKTPMLPSKEACIARHAALLSPPLPVPSPPLPLPSPLTTSPTDTGSPLGYRAAMIRMRALLPSTSRMTYIPKADLLPQKRICLTTLVLRFEVGESFAAGAARQPGPTDSDLRRCRVEQTGPEHPPSPDYVPGPEHPPLSIEIPYVPEPKYPEYLVPSDAERVIELDTMIRQRTDEFEVRFKEAHDDQAFLRARVNTLFRDWPDHRHTTMLLDREVIYAREAWTGSEYRSAAIAAHLQTLEAQVAALISQTSSLQTQLTTTLRRIEILKARYPEPQVAEASSSC
nr:hypothetical protein [Tanacetum cinerariifolium]